MCQKVIKHKENVSRHKKTLWFQKNVLIAQCLEECDKNDNFVKHQENCLQKKDNKCSLYLKQFKSHWYLKNVFREP